MMDRSARKEFLARRELTADERRILRCKIHIYTAVMGAGYFALIAWLLTGGLTEGLAQSSLAALILAPILLFLAPALVFLAFAAQMTVLDFLSERVPFRLNAIISLPAGLVLAWVVLQLIMLVRLVYSFF